MDSAEARVSVSLHWREKRGIRRNTKQPSRVSPLGCWLAKLLDERDLRGSQRIRQPRR